MTLSHRLRAAAGNASGGIVTTGLAQYWDFGDPNCYNTNVSTTTITDLSGVGNHGYFLSSQPTYYSANGGYVQNTALFNMHKKVLLLVLKSSKIAVL